jgi:hypothetical protein
MADSGVRYVGDGAFIQGVPARDLTAEEWAAVPSELQTMAVAARIFEPMVSEHEQESES